ncbi:F-box only protein 33 [Halotydeus destructor]|nr:F-box only protein 33 [Halotydeus destructor]
MAEAEENIIATWAHIPTVILFHIFSFLPRVDRIRASASCQRWRECLFHPKIWPKPSIIIDLIVSVQNEASFNFCSSQDTSRGFCNETNQKSLLPLLSKAARSIHYVTIKFDPSSLDQVYQLVQVLRVLDEYSVREELLASDLKGLTLKPSGILSLRRLSTQNNNAAKFSSLTDNGHASYELIDCLWFSLRSLIKNARGIERVALGGIEELMNRVPELLTVLNQVDAHRHTLQSLHLATIKEDPDYYQLFDVEPNMFLPLASLKVLSIDFDYVSDELLKVLAKHESLEKIVIHVHGIDDEHPGVSKSSWSLLANKESLDITLNILHTEEPIERINDHILETDIPLTHLRIYFTGLAKDDGREIVALIDTVATRHQDKLKSLTLVDFIHEDLLPNTSFTQLNENPLVMLAWRCKNLEYLEVIGFEISEVDLLAISRLRGQSMTQLIVPSCCVSIMHSTGEEASQEEEKTFLDLACTEHRKNICEEIGKPLGQSWLPIETKKLPKCYLQETNDPVPCYMQHILHDQSQ